MNGGKTSRQQHSQNHMSKINTNKHFLLNFANLRGKQVYTNPDFKKHHSHHGPNAKQYSVCKAAMKPNAAVRQAI